MTALAFHLIYLTIETFQYTSISHEKIKIRIEYKMRNQKRNFQPTR